VGLKRSVPAGRLIQRDGFRRTLVGLKLDSSDDHGELKNTFQTNPRGVEAGRERRRAPVRVAFQTNPRGVEAV